jgi:hypothetical protein
MIAASLRVSAWIIVVPWWREIQPSCYETLSFNEPIVIIQAENLHRHSAFRSQREDRCFIPPEVFRPNLRAGIKQRNKDVSERIKRANIWPLVAIAAQARERKVILLSFTSMLTWHDVVWLMPMQRYCLWQQTILTARAGPVCNQLAQPG